MAHARVLMTKIGWVFRSSYNIKYFEHKSISALLFCLTWTLHQHFMHMVEHKPEAPVQFQRYIFLLPWIAGVVTDFTMLHTGERRTQSPESPRTRRTACRASSIYFRHSCVEGFSRELDDVEVKSADQPDVR